VKYNAQNGSGEEEEYTIYLTVSDKIEDMLEFISQIQMVRRRVSKY
jgi:hypothetical protein